MSSEVPANLLNAKKKKKKKNQKTKKTNNTKQNKRLPFQNSTLLVAEQSSPRLLPDLAIYPVCVCVCVSVCLSVCWGDLGEVAVLQYF